jgi:leucyl-tRNA synthetase family protein
MASYDHKKIEKKWQKEWDNAKLYKTSDSKKGSENFYTLVEFPYPSGNLHTGHWYAFSVPDIFARKKRMDGHNVMFPIGFDAFGLPAENAAIKRKLNPMKWTFGNIANMKKQIRSMGASFDWSREVITADPEYYKWTQWLFLEFFKKGLAYQAETLVNWCPKDKTVLANEQVVNGCCERCGSEVLQKKMKQWMLKITDYAEKLLKGLDSLDWPEEIKASQRNWIGKSEGAEIDFEIAGEVDVSYVLLHGYTGSTNNNFFPWLKKELEKRGAKVYAPKLPSTNDPNVYDQVESVLSEIPFDENTIIVGHSLGGVVALKILEKLKKPVKKTVLVNSFVENNFISESFEAYTFDWKFDLARIKTNAGSISILRDLTDDTVPQYQAEKIQKLFGGIIYDFSAAEPHSGGDKEPEILRICINAIRVFTTRPDTLFGATYMVLAPDHALVEQLKSQIKNWKSVEEYIKKTVRKTERERQQGEKEKTGVDLKGVFAINPANKKEIPVWIADYVLSGYGTGAIMAVPAHDQRDFEFANKFNLPITMVVCPHWPAPTCPVLDEAYSGNGHMVASGKFDGMENEKAKKAITEFVGGKFVSKYKLRDWVVSRQRYWGVPIPVIHCDECGVVSVSEKDLPVKLPAVKDYLPTGEGKSPLAKAKSWMKVKCPKCNGVAQRETDTLDTFVDSSWYFLRYTDPKNKKAFADDKKMKAWMPVDLYSGGAEHTTMHLLYSRFFTKALHDFGLITLDEPYTVRKNRGIVLGPDGHKMSKSKENVIDPDEYVEKFGADTVRMYLAFLGPYDQVGSYPWNPQSILGIKRFLDRVWKLYEVAKNDSISSRLTLKGSDTSRKSNNFLLLHKTIKKVGEDIEAFHFNTAISQLMILLNEMEKVGADKKSYSIFLRLLAPFAPHMAEELWQRLNKSAQGGPASGWKSIHLEKWPEYNEKLTQDETFELVIQINGKTCDKVNAKISISEKEATSLTLNSEKVKKHIGDKKPKKIIFVPRRLINIVL